MRFLTNGEKKVIFQALTIIFTLVAIIVSVVGITDVATLADSSDCSDCNPLTKTSLDEEVDLVSLTFGCINGCSSCQSSSVPLFAESCDESDITPIAFKRKVEGNLPDFIIPALLIFFDFLFSIISAVLTLGILIYNILSKSNIKQSTKRCTLGFDICILAVGFILLIATIIISYTSSQFYSFTFKNIYLPTPRTLGCLQNVKETFWENESKDDQFFDSQLFGKEFVSWTWTTTTNWPDICTSARSTMICTNTTDTQYLCTNTIVMKDTKKLDDNTNDLKSFIADNIILGVIGLVSDVIALLFDYLCNLRYSVKSSDFL